MMGVGGVTGLRVYNTYFGNPLGGNVCICGGVVAGCLFSAL